MLCKKCNEQVTDWLRKEFSKLHSGKDTKPVKYSTFLRRLSKLIFDSTGNVNASIYTSAFSDKMREIEKQDENRL